MFLALMKLAGHSVFLSWSFGARNTVSHIVRINPARNGGHQACGQNVHSGGKKLLGK